MTKAQARPAVIEGYCLVQYILENKYPRAAIDVRHPDGRLAFELDEPRLLRLARHPGVVRATLNKEGYIRCAELLCHKSTALRLLRVLPSDLPARASHNRQDPGRKGWVIRQERSRSGQMGSSRPVGIGFTHERRKCWCEVSKLQVKPGTEHWRTCQKQQCAQATAA